VLTLPASVRIYLAAEPVDLRRGFDGLAAAVRTVVGADPLSGHLFVFLNQSRNRAKILVWEASGFWLFYKRLEVGRFKLPTAPASGTRHMALRGAIHKRSGHCFARGVHMGWLRVARMRSSHRPALSCERRWSIASACSSSQ
jgi:transposase